MKFFTAEKRRTLLAAVIPAAIMAALLSTVGIYFETNDDRCITEILAGILSPGPDAHAVYINYLLAWPLSLAYRAAPWLPWYGGMLILFQLVLYFCMLDSAFSCCTGRMETAVTGVAGTAFIVSNLYLSGKIQFTSTAAMLAAAGYVCLLLDRREKRGLCRFAVLELLAFLLRGQSMLMIQPVGMAVFGGWIICQREQKLSEKCIKILRGLAVPAAVLLIGAMGHMAGYHTPEWREYEEYNRARTELFDYYGVPSYEECRMILDRYGVTQAQYQAFGQYDNLYGEINAACARELADYARQNAGRGPDFKTVLTGLIQNVLHGEFRGSNTMMLAAWLLFGVVILFKRNWRLLLPAAGLAVSEALVWGYLLVRGRTPLRVTLPLFFCATAFLLALSLRQERGGETAAERMILLAVCAVLVGKGLTAGLSQYRYMKQNNEIQKTYMAGMYQIQDYCEKYPDRKYVIEAGALTYYQGSALETEIYRKRDSMAAGCWYSNSPSMRNRIKEYLGEGLAGFDVIVYEDGNSSSHVILEYLREKLDVEPVKQDQFTVTNGAVYAVYSFDAE